MIKIILKRNREKSLIRRHPWIFSGAIAEVEGKPQPGETVNIRGADNTDFGSGAYSPHSQIRVRVWTFNPGEEVTPTFFQTRLEQALALRDHIIQKSDLPSYRLINAESDGFPGLIVDRYADFLVCQFLSAGAEFQKDTIVEQLNKRMPNSGIYERSDAAVRKKEGLVQQVGVLSGNEPPELLEINEGPYKFFVDIKNGHKTGFYLDQRENRNSIAAYAQNAQVLNCFSYTGGFTVTALKGGAESVTNIDSSASALELLQKNIIENNLDTARIENRVGDVAAILRHYRDADRRFDMIILDPPKFAESRSQVQKASRGYKDINLLSCKLLRPDGILVTFSCSGLVSRDLFQKIVADAALDAGRDVQIIRQLSQSPDHPVATNFPEGNYLKGMVCRVC